MSRSSQLARLVIAWLVGIGVVAALASSPLQASSRSAQEIEPAGVLTDIGFYPLVVSGKTDIAVAVCASSSQFQLRSEQPGKFITQIFVRATVCPPKVANSWRAVVGAVPGESFIVYVWAADVLPDEANFMARATRYSVTVTALGQLNVQRIPHVAMTGNWEDPGAGATIQGTVNLKGWLLDLANWNSAGIDQVELYHGTTLLDAVGYGVARPDVAAAFGDSRYTSSGFSYNLDTNRLPNGVQTLSIRYRSAAFGQWQQIDRQFNVHNAAPVNQPPHAPTPIAPANGAVLTSLDVTLQVLDNGDPDNGPNPTRSFTFAVERGDGTGGFTPIGTTAQINVRLPGYGNYRWRALANDGEANSAWSAWSTLTVGIASPIPAPPAPRTRPDGSWNVPFLWQGNPAWGGNRIGACDNNIQNVGCALTSLTMIFRHYGVDQNPGTLNSCMGGAACPLWWASPTISSCSQRKVAFSAWEQSFSYARLEQVLKSGPVILELGNNNGGMHFIVVVGGSGSNPSNYIVNDPGIKNGGFTRLSNSLSIFKMWPVGLRLYTGTAAPNAASLASDSLIPLQSPIPTVTESITGTLVLFDATETQLILELAAQSSAGAVTEMQIWTDQQSSEAWQPFSAYVQVPFHQTFYVRFRDAAGNVSRVVSTGVPVVNETIDLEVRRNFLPFIRR